MNWNPEGRCSFCVKGSFSSNNFFISQPIYFIFTHIVTQVKIFSQTCNMTLTFRWPWHLTLFFNNFYHFALKFWISVITLSLVHGFTSYSHTVFLRSRPFHLALWPWPSDDLDIQHCSLTIFVKNPALMRIVLFILVN